ncbi:MAG: potassium-transporting ATPase subunit KdpC [Bacteroidota bacterium]|jgi:K+-transporting ATPase ATPase C chain
MKNFKIALKMLFLMTIITGLLYPLAITGFAQLFYPNKSSGSMIYEKNKILGSELIGQGFTKPEFFWGRPSAIANNPMPSGGSNLSPVGKVFKEQFKARVDAIRKYHGNTGVNQIPKDLLFASASGVDPHISPDAALFQVVRIVEARHLNSVQKEQLIKIIQNSIENPDLFILGEPRVKVLKLNIKLKGL